MTAFRKKPADAEALLKRMAALCARSEQCTFDISTKLYKAGLPREKREEIISYLQTHLFLDDVRFARSFANYKVRYAAWGRRKIRMALLAKRIDSQTISEALDSIDEEEYIEAFNRALEAKKRELDPSQPQTRAKLYRHMLGRGFESDLISNSL